MAEKGHFHDKKIKNCNYLETGGRCQGVPPSSSKDPYTSLTTTKVDLTDQVKTRVFFNFFFFSKNDPRGQGGAVTKIFFSVILLLIGPIITVDIVKIDAVVEAVKQNQVFKNSTFFSEKLGSDFRKFRVRKKIFFQIVKMSKNKGASKKSGQNTVQEPRNRPNDTP